MVRTFTRGQAVTTHRRLTLSHPHLRGIALLIACLCAPLAAERLTITPRQIESSWDLPGGAVRLQEGRLHPFRFRKEINAALRAQVRGAGTDLSGAASVFDGDERTGWAPGDADLDDQWLELDLRQALPVQSVTVRFDTTAPPFEFFEVAFSDGERFIDVANVLVEGTLLYGDSHSFSFNERHAVRIDLEDQPVRVVRLKRTRRGEAARVVEIEVEAIGDNLGFDLIERGGSVEVVAEIVALAGTPSVMFDGDLATAWRVNPLSKGSTGGRETYGDYRIDLGASYRFDEIKLFGEPIAIQPRSRHFYANFLSYQILTSDGSLAPDGSLRWDVLVDVPANQRNLLEERTFEHRFDPVAARYLRLYYPTSQGGGIIGGGADDSNLRLDGLGFVAEFQIFGDGYPERIVMRSPVIDLGADWNVSALSWDAEVDPGARVQLRSRSGVEVDREIYYYDKNGREVTERRYGQLIASFRGPIDTVTTVSAGWSGWSEAYLESGSAFRSPSPRRYLQLEAELLSDDASAAAALGAIHLDYTRPLATQAIAEVLPARVEPGTPTTFRWILQPTYQQQDFGFDRVVLASTVPMNFRDLSIDGLDVEPSAVETTDDGFRLRLPAGARNPGQVEIRFDATVFQRTRFHGVLEGADGSLDLRQAVDPGDAAPGLGVDSDVVSLPVNDVLVANLALSTPVLTPNGDGVHDEAVLSFDALKLTSPRSITATVLDVGGRIVRQLQRRGQAGHYDIPWDGRDDSGQRVPPGIYLMHLQIDGDAARRSATRTVAVVY